MNNSNLPYLNEIENKNVNTFLHTIVKLDENKSNEITISLYDINKNEINEKLTLIVDYYSLSGINNENYSFYLSKGINIYNKNDPAFTDECYRNTKFDYDLTNNYRKHSLYQGDITSTSCKKQNNNIEGMDKILFSCEPKIPFFYIISRDSLSVILKDSTKNLSLYCINKVKEIGKNAAFWIYFILAIIIIVSTFLLFKFKQIDCEQAAYSINYDNLLTCLKDNFIYLHPILCLFHKSFFSPLYFNFWLLIFNISNLFGFNAILYNEKLVEKKIYDKNRNSFAYPMKKNFGIIISAILISMIITSLMKLFNLIPSNERNDANFDLKKDDSKRFENQMLMVRIFVGIIMLSIYFFMWIYSIGFCFFYYHTQKTWIYAGFWSLFFNWVIFAPLFICILSFIEIIWKNNEIIFFMKKLFCF